MSSPIEQPSTSAVDPAAAIKTKKRRVNTSMSKVIRIEDDTLNWIRASLRKIFVLTQGTPEGVPNRYQCAEDTPEFLVAVMRVLIKRPIALISSLFRNTKRKTIRVDDNDLAWTELPDSLRALVEEAKRKAHEEFKESSHGEDAENKPESGDHTKKNRADRIGFVSAHKQWKEFFNNNLVLDSRKEKLSYEKKSDKYKNGFDFITAFRASVEYIVADICKSTMIRLDELAEKKSQRIEEHRRAHPKSSGEKSKNEQAERRSTKIIAEHIYDTLCDRPEYAFVVSNLFVGYEFQRRQNEQYVSSLYIPHDMIKSRKDRKRTSSEANEEEEEEEQIVEEKPRKRREKEPAIEKKKSKDGAARNGTPVKEKRAASKSEPEKKKTKSEVEKKTSKSEKKK